MWTLPKTFRSGDMALFACHYDQRLCSFSIKKTKQNAPMVLDTITNDTVCEPLARSDDYLLTRATFFDCLWVDSFLLTHLSYDISTWFVQLANCKCGTAHHAHFAICKYMYSCSTHSCGYSSSGLTYKVYSSNVLRQPPYSASASYLCCFCKHYLPK